MGLKYFLCYQRYSLIYTCVGEMHNLLIYKINLDRVHGGVTTRKTGGQWRTIFGFLIGYMLVE
jgi:hypothetical protein